MLNSSVIPLPSLSFMEHDLPMVVAAKVFFIKGLVTIQSVA